MSDGQFLLRAKNVHKSYLMGKVTLSVLRGASMNIRPGELLVVMGASGSGKSTLLHVIGALDNPDSGNVSFEGLDVFSQSAAFRESLRCHTIGFVFQFYHLLPELTVLENTLIPKMVKCPTINWRSERSRAREAALAILDDVGLSHRIGHRPNELSGGERQRVAIARALVNQPKLLLADEPTGNLDKKSGGGILELLARFNERGQTIVVVTHDPDTAACAHRRVLLEDGQIRPT